ncbi:protein serine/threonine phosphatase 2C, partial [Rickenella mellea]
KRVLYTANVGDTRAVLCRGGKAIELTVEHKPNEPNEWKRLQEAAKHFKYGLDFSEDSGPDGSTIHRVGGRSNSRAFGHPADYILAVPDVSRTELQDDDEFLIIASDGLWDAMKSNDYAVTLVRNVLEPLEACTILNKHAIEFGAKIGYYPGHDDTTVMVIRFSAPPQ